MSLYLDVIWFAQFFFLKTEMKPLEYDLTMILSYGSRNEKLSLGKMAIFKKQVCVTGRFVYERVLCIYVYLILETYANIHIYRYCVCTFIIAIYINF